MYVYFIDSLCNISSAKYIKCTFIVKASNVFSFSMFSHFRRRSLISDNYHTLTSRDYTAPTLHTGREHLPVTSSHALSGYAHNLPLTRQPLSKSLSSNTSYRNNYPKKDFRTHKADSGSNDLKEDTGFTHAYNVEPITFRPNECHVTNLPGHVTWRPTGQSLMKRDYVSCPPLGGQEPLATVTTHSCRSNGFIKGNNNPTQAQPINIKVNYSYSEIPLYMYAIFTL